MTRLSDQLEAAMKAGTQGVWTIVPYGDGDSLVIHSGNDWRICFMATPGDFGVLDAIKSNAEQIVLLHNNLPTIIAALRERGE